MGELGELPNIDDLEVAAAAAGVAPVPAVLAEMGYFELGRQPEEEKSSSEDEEDSSDEGAEWAGAGQREDCRGREGGVCVPKPTPPPAAKCAHCAGLSWCGIGSS